MMANGSPAPVFESDEERTAFVIRLPIHARSPVVSGEVTGEVTGEVEKLLLALNGEMPRTGLQLALGLRHEDNFRKLYLLPALSV
jgi:ATP-dependent DNA helicase RecG